MFEARARFPGARRADTIALGALVFGCLALYVSTLCPTVYWYDSAEFAAHAAALSVPHPPGYPLYTLIAHAFTWLPGEPAWCVNVMSLVFGIVATVVLYLLGRAVGLAVWSAASGAAVLATSRTFWANAVVAEVYTPGLSFSLGVFLLLGVAERRRQTRWEVLAGFVAGLGVGVHMSIATLGIAFAWLVLSRRGRAARTVREEVGRVAAVVGAVFAGLLIFLYIPLRTFEHWNRNEWRKFYLNATGGTFRRKFHEANVWDRTGEMLDIFVDNVHWVGLGLMLAGVVALMIRQRRWAVAFVLGLLGNVGTFFNYHVPDLDVFVLPSIALVCLLVGAGAEAVGQWLGRVRPGLASVGWAVVALPIVAAVHNYPKVDLSERTEGARYAADVCNSMPPNAVIISYSSPLEWRHYAVFLYVQKALERCVHTPVLIKPSVVKVRALLSRPGTKVYAFVRPQRPEVWDAHAEEEGALWRILPHS